MNYRHAFHAGNFADVLKHAILTLALEVLAAKDKPLVVIDTHAGRGRYDLAQEAQRTGEWQHGVGKVLQASRQPRELKRYVDIVRGFDRRMGGTGETLQHYPGSPRIVRALLRPGDRLVTCELHDEDGLALRREFAGDPLVEIRRADGYAALKAVLPPPERRGLVLIDPPFEAKDEFEKLQRALTQALRRFATGTYLIWYPVKDQEAVAGFRTFLTDAKLKRTLTAELQVGSKTPTGLARAGVALINAPWPLENDLEKIGRYLAQALGGAQGRFDLEWIAKD